jgi:hypothetical protein
MRVISTRTHGVLDYLTGATLLSAPSLLGLTDVPASAQVFRLAGGGAMLYSLLTDYELSVVRVLPMPLHLAMDAASGALLASSPWLFGFAKEARATGCRMCSGALPRCSPRPQPGCDDASRRKETGGHEPYARRCLGAGAQRGLRSAQPAGLCPTRGGGSYADPRRGSPHAAPEGFTVGRCTSCRPAIGHR